MQFFFQFASLYHNKFKANQARDRFPSLLIGSFLCLDLYAFRLLSANSLPFVLIKVP